MIYIFIGVVVLLLSFMLLMAKARTKFPALSDEAIELLRMREVCDD